MTKLVIGLVGYSGSGKGVFSELLREKYGIPVISTGNFVREETLRRGFELTSENITNVSNQIRKETDGVFLRALRKKIDENLESHGAVAIDCLREMSDYRELAGFKDRRLVVVSISSSDAVRYLRIAERKREQYVFSESEFKKLTEFERELGIDSLVKVSNYTITNDKDRISFEHESLALLLRMEKEKGLVKKI